MNEQSPKNHRLTDNLRGDVAAGNDAVATDDGGWPLLSFAAAFFTRWYIVISGPLGIPLTWVGAAETKGAPHLGFMAALIVCCTVTAYFLWRGENLAAIQARGRLAEIKAGIRRRLWLSFSTDDDGCVRPNQRILLPISANEAMPTTVTYYRVRVDATSMRATDGCSGHLSDISKDGVPIMKGESVPLAFAGDAKDALAKRVYPGVPEYLNFLMISASNHVVPSAYKGMGHGGVPWVDLFKQPGEYRFRIVVTAVQMTSTIEIALTWTGDHKTAEIRKAG
jgi:hypothetical protein